MVYILVGISAFFRKLTDIYIDDIQIGSIHKLHIFSIAWGLSLAIAIVIKPTLIYLYLPIILLWIIRNKLESYFHSMPAIVIILTTIVINVDLDLIILSICLFSIIAFPFIKKRVKIIPNFLNEINFHIIFLTFFLSLYSTSFIVIFISWLLDLSIYLSLKYIARYKIASKLHDNFYNLKGGSIDEYVNTIKDFSPKDLNITKIYNAEVSNLKQIYYGDNILNKSGLIVNPQSGNKENLDIYQFYKDYSRVKENKNIITKVFSNNLDRVKYINKKYIKHYKNFIFLDPNLSMDIYDNHLIITYAKEEKLDIAYIKDEDVAKILKFILLSKKNIQINLWKGLKQFFNNHISFSLNTLKRWHVR